MKASEEAGKCSHLIRQAISCDVCGADMQQTNHWFIARRLGDELRITRWNVRIRSRKGARHLCGQTCLHKLLDEFLAENLGAHSPAARSGTAEPKIAHTPRISPGPTDASLTSRLAAPVLRSIATLPEPYTDEYDSSARLISAPDAAFHPLPPAALINPSNPVDAWKREQARLQSESQSRSARRRSIA